MSEHQRCATITHMKTYALMRRLLKWKGHRNVSFIWDEPYMLFFIRHVSGRHRNWDSSIGKYFKKHHSLSYTGGRPRTINS